MIFSLKNKIALITGGGSGIGRAIAECFAGQGAEVYILDVGEKAAQQVADEMHAKGFKGSFARCDVSDHHETRAVVEQIIKSAGKIDILVNCAGIPHVANLEKTTEEDFDKVFRVNVKGMFNTMNAVVPQMKVQQKGVILNMASVASIVGVSERFSYSMSKGAVVGMTLSVAKDYIKEGIRCNCISPARVHTPFVDGFIQANYPGKEKETFEKLSKTQPIGRMGKPEEVAYLALYLCSDEAAFVTGCDYPIDGGFVKLNS